MIPTDGVYPIATANDKSKISAPIMSRFAVIEIPDYTKEEKKVIFKKFALPKILKRMGMREEEIEITDDGLDEIVELCSSSSGIRDVEQVAEHIAANALYQIEAEGATKPVYDANTVRALIL
jgi:ATP-dependent Lon protease